MRTRRSPASEETPSDEGDGEGDDDEDDDDAGGSPPPHLGFARGQGQSGLALAAIQTGQSFAEFKANVKAASSGARTQLQATLSGSPRLGADAPAGARPGASCPRVTRKAKRAASLKR